MNKGELIELLANEKGSTKADAERTINFIFNSFRKTLCEGGSVQIAGFGGFVVKTRKARMGRNPKTNDPIQIPAGKVNDHIHADFEDFMAQNIRAQGRIPTRIVGDGNGRQPAVGE